MRIPSKPSRTSASGSTVAATVLTLASSGAAAGRLAADVSGFQPQAATASSRTGNTVAVNTLASQKARASGLERAPSQAVSFVRDFNARLDLPPARLKEKLAQMRQSPSAMFRAMPALFHADLRGPYAQGARLTDRPAPDIRVVGDAHVGNLGTFRGPEGKAVWGLNDFDQAGTASPEADLTRLATSAVLTAREAGLSTREQVKAVEALAKNYFETLELLADGDANPGAFLEKKESSGPVKDLITQARDTSAKDALSKYVKLDGAKGPRFLNSDTLKPLAPERKAAVRTALASYEKTLAGTEGVAVPLKVLDLAERLDAGGSSYGLERDYVLVGAAEPKAPPVLLELKELLASGVASPPVPANGADVVKAQEELGGAVNPLTGAVSMGGRAFLVREVEPEKARLDDAVLGKKKSLRSTFEQAGVVLARAHGHTQARARCLEDWVGGDTKEATKRLVAFAQAYADQAEADWKALKAAR
ncbi:DUF2252 domain-containing protein [Corallococcus interemptor]|uniref:DUF2252 domain-containing protein n=2 Tax=Corallococcus TaxID=83461 RepID=A0A3A8Q228_9BACT|nr:DUF2252 family protein [Corallococcus interemptor]RKH58912.1 DUF2252 domain-containing protein [Corallococcus interemptor]